MKKKIAWALCLGLGCLTLAGCSGSSEPFEAKTYTPEGQVQGVQLDVEDREVEVALSLSGRRNRPWSPPAAVEPSGLTLSGTFTGCPSPPTVVGSCPPCCWTTREVHRPRRAHPPLCEAGGEAGPALPGKHLPPLPTVEVFLLPGGHRPHPEGGRLCIGLAVARSLAQANQGPARPVPCPKPSGGRPQLSL